MDMTHKKIWNLYKTDINKLDAIFLKGLGCEIELIMPTPLDFTSSDGYRWHYIPENPHIEITTTCEKQESMLYLKYGSDIQLKTIIHRKLEPSYADIDLASHSRSTT